MHHYVQDSGAGSSTLLVGMGVGVQGHTLSSAVYTVVCVPSVGVYSAVQIFTRAGRTQLPEQVKRTVL